jgi:hypothetical protein
MHTRALFDRSAMQHFTLKVILASDFFSGNSTVTGWGAECNDNRCAAGLFCFFYNLTENLLMSGMSTIEFPMVTTGFLKVPLAGI